ncbi:MAG: response regulator, partial [Proteobacteria bacterium]|nr:response regulator [Pseudomonadota bacterium]
LIHSENGQYLYSIDVVEDITLQNKLEKQLRQAQKMESIGILAGGIAHDFNNILGSILGFTQMALLDSPEKSKMRQRLEQVFKAGNLAKDLVNQILTFSRRSDDTPRAILISPIIKETLKFLKALVPPNVDIQQDFLDTSGSVMADPIQIHQVVMNLCTNAAQAMSPQGGILTVHLFQKDIESEQAKKMDIATGSYVVIRVTDIGVGIAPHLLDRIFEPYYTTKDVGEGTGMGLAVVHGIVREYEGKVIVDSTLGKGSTFSVYLPKVQPKELVLPTATSSIPGGQERVFFIDDNLSLLMVGQEMLEHLGYKAETFSDPIQALERVIKGPFNFQAVIVDYAMPKMNGAELAHRILSLDPEIPVILCTGNSKNLDIDELLHSGIHSILIKPLILEDLASALKSAFHAKQSCPGKKIN